VILVIKECAKRKLIITAFALLVFFITLLFPKTENEIKNITISYTNKEPSGIYLLSENNLVARTNMVIQTETDIDRLKEIISILTIDSTKSTYIPALFSPIIPRGTSILSVDIQNNIAKINFSKEFLNIPQNKSLQMIESIVYSLTEIENIQGVILFVEGNILEKAPNTTTKLPPLLTRDIGINTMYELSDLKNTTKTTTYYIAKNDYGSYYVPVTLISNNSKDKVEIIIERLKSQPTSHSNLMSYLHASTELTNYELLENEVMLSFNPYLYEGLASEELKEEVKFSIALSMKDTLNVDKVTFQEN